MGNLKWVTGGLGWVMGGPIGGVIGLAAGYLIEEMTRPTEHPKSQQSTSGRSTTMRGDFTMSFLVLIAAVMKADGKVLKLELDFVKQHLLKMYGYEGAKEATRMLGDILKHHIPVQDVSQQIRRNMDYSSRLEMVHLLFGIASSDGKVSESETQTISMIASGMGLSSSDWNAIKAMFINDTEWTYKVLEIEPTATEEEIKKAYRKMAIKFHPDKVAHLGDEYQNKAKEKFQKVNQAYEELKKAKGFN